MNKDKMFQVAHGRASYQKLTHFNGSGFYYQYHPRVAGVTFVGEFSTIEEAKQQARLYINFCRNILINELKAGRNS
ncbi:MAG: hypothetical protein OSB62_08960 [Alphaproteobacteria bacterium]|nr:hypothetical protein [Alphaproteobacteria bacterium]